MKTYKIGFIIVILLIFLYILHVDTRLIVLSGLAIAASVYLYDKHKIVSGGDFAWREISPGLWASSDKLTFVGKIQREYSPDEKPLYGICTKVTPDNYSFWLSYATYWRNKESAETNPIAGIGHFVESITSTKLNVPESGETWVAFLTTLDPKLKIIPYLTEDSPAAFESYMKFMVIMVTIKTGKDSLVTSHMGVQRTPIYSHMKPFKDRYRGSANTLHSFGTRAMLYLNPSRKYQVNTPVVVMRALFLKLKNVYCGTKEDCERFKQLIYVYENKIDDINQMPPLAQETYSILLAEEISADYISKTWYEWKKLCEERPPIINKIDSRNIMIDGIFDTRLPQDKWLTYHDDLYPTAGENIWVAVDLAELSEHINLDTQYSPK